MTYDLLIKGGTIVDGTGRPCFTGDVAIKNGKIVAVGEAAGAAKRVIDASGKIVAPGFIDCHTHYDAQLFWDPSIDPATWHGVTTVAIGNCGFTIAPVRKGDEDYVHGLFSATEEVPKEVLVKHAKLKWETFPEYLDVLEKTKLGVNILTQIGHSAIRRFVMGEDSIKREASPQEVDAMVRLAEEAMDVGAFGVSTSFSPHHIDYSGGHIPSYYASDDETEALAVAVGRKGKKSFALNPRSKREGISDADRALMSRLAEKSGVTISWNDFGSGAANAIGTLEFMESEIAAGRDIRVVARCQPAETRFQLHQISPLYSGQEIWRTFAKLSRQEQKLAIVDPEWRGKLAEFWKGVRYLDFASIEKVDAPALKPLIGKYLADIAEERGVDRIDLMFDIALEDNLDTFFLLRARKSSREDEAKRILKSPSTLIGVSDGGAHLQTFAGADWPTYFLKHWVRETGAFTLEEAVHALTKEVADFIGITDRGTLEVGMAGDVTIFDADEVQPERLETLDFPGVDMKRLAKKARGVPFVIVNGTPVIDEGKKESATPGVLLRV